MRFFYWHLGGKNIKNAATSFFVLAQSYHIIEPRQRNNLQSVVVLLPSNNINASSIFVSVHFSKIAFQYL